MQQRPLSRLPNSAFERARGEKLSEVGRQQCAAQRRR